MAAARRRARRWSKGQRRHVWGPGGCAAAFSFLLSVSVSLFLPLICSVLSFLFLVFGLSVLMEGWRQENEGLIWGRRWLFWMGERWCDGGLEMEEATVVSVVVTVVMKDELKILEEE